MAPVKIKHVVSFMSQDPKYPVENLLLEEDPRPWLSCPQDRSRVSKVELQLEQASHIGYVDIGNCGSAFLQIDVGRSSWPTGQSYPTLLPTVTLMTPADAKLDKNRSGVRMFKEGDFLAAALEEKWDRVRLICSQPFNKHAQFGLSFIRIRTPLDDHGSKADLPSSPVQTPPESTESPWLSSAAICRTFFAEAPASSAEEVALKTRLQQLDPTSSPGTRSPVCLSRPSRMVLEAATARKRSFPLNGPTLPAMETQEEAPLPEDLAQSCTASQKLMQKREVRHTNTHLAMDLAVQEEEFGFIPCSPLPKESQSGLPTPSLPLPATDTLGGSGQESSTKRDGVKTKRKRAPCRGAGRSVAASSVRPRLGSRREGRGRGRKGRWQKMESRKELGEEDSSGPEEARVGLGTCPICNGRFPADLLPAHASCCGEEGLGASPPSSPSSWEEPSEVWVCCPICQLRFPAAEVEAHASSCGEPPPTLPSWLWAEQGE